jgi:hypothetical protein
LTFVLAYPLSIHPASRVYWMGVDTELFLWTLAWNAHALVTSPLAIFDANIFHPLKNTLAYTENLIGSTLFAGPVLWTTDNPVLALNVVQLSSIVLCGLGTFVLARRLGISALGAALAGIVFAFSPPRFGRIGQLHLTTVQWIPFALAALHAYLDGGRKLHLRLAIGLFTLQALTSGHGAVFLLFAFAMLLGYRVVLGERITPVRRLRDVGLPGLLLLVPAAFLVMPYRLAQQEIGLRRTLDPTWWTDWASPAVSFIATPARLPQALLQPLVGKTLWDNAGAYLFPGFLPLALAAIAVVGRWRARAREKNRDAEARRRLAWCWVTAASVAAGVAGLALAVYIADGGRVTLKNDADEMLLRIRNPWRPAIAGLLLLFVGLVSAPRAGVPLRSWRMFGQRRGDGVPTMLRWRVAWEWWGARRRQDNVLFYTLLTAAMVWLSAGAPIGPWPWLYSLPGFSFIRVPSRFTILALLGLAVLAGFGFDRLRTRMDRTGNRRLAWALAIVLGACLSAEFSMVPVRAVPYRADIPAVDRWLDSRPKPFVVAEVPFSSEADHTAYMLHSTAHWQRTVNGYSGFRPPLHEGANPHIRRFPARESLEAMARLGVTYVVVHRDRYRADVWAWVEQELPKAGDWIRLEHEEGAGRVYSLHVPSQ